MDGATSSIIDPEIKRNVDRWLEGAYDETSKQEVLQMLKEDPAKVLEAFCTTLSFGTGGLRGIMGVGSNRINKYTIGTVIQGIANYLKTLPKEEKKLSVLIGYDSRHNSRFFAEIAAKILAGNDIKVLLFRELRPTPLVSFGCRQKRCHAAIMITASHNPPEYNGCKVFWGDGAQVLAPHDKNIIEEVKKISDVDMVHTVSQINHPLIQEIDKEIDEAYIEMSSHMQNYREENQCRGADLKIVYTSLHGTGITIVPGVLKRWGFTDIAFVAAQIIPDPSFPTVSSPNPEEGQALTLGIEQLQNVKGDLLIATDPDGDRVAVAIRHGAAIEALTGNQIAVLLLNHVCKALTSKNKMAANGAFIKTLVTTELFQAICDYYQKPCFNVLPGFKYIAEKIRHWENEPRGHQFIFGAEESCGYLFGKYVRDKDAVFISALIAEMALQAKLKGKTLIDNLNELYQQFGCYHEQVAILPFEASKKGRMQMAELMLMLRRMPPRKISSIPVSIIEDYERSVRIDLLSHEQAPLSLAKANMLLFRLADGSKLVIRPSGTEPKIKIYCGVVKKQFTSVEAGSLEAQAHAMALINALVTQVASPS